MGTQLGSWNSAPLRYVQETAPRCCVHAAAWVELEKPLNKILLSVCSSVWICISASNLENDHSGFI